VAPEPPHPTDGSHPSDADRDRLAAALGRHYAAGRLDLTELDGRLEKVLGAASVIEAAGALDGLGPLEASTPPRRGWRRRHGESVGAQPGWVPTLERFRDPATNRLMRVWIDPVDSSRNYVAEA